jgi:hypothetical protein
VISEMWLSKKKKKKKKKVSWLPQALGYLILNPGCIQKSPGSLTLILIPRSLLGLVSQDTFKVHQVSLICSQGLSHLCVMVCSTFEQFHKKGI